MQERAFLLRGDGLSIREIAERLDTPASTVGDWLKGVPAGPATDVDDQSDTAESDRLRKLLRVCGGPCGATKSWAEFYAAAKWSDGTVRRPQYICKECVKAGLRQRRREDPQWAREINKKNWQRIKKDPDKLRRRRELTRENGIVHRLRRREQSAA